MGKYQTPKGRILESELSKYMILSKVRNKEELRQHTTVGSNVTMLKYLDNPERMPIGNMIEIMSALKIPKEVRLHIMEQLIDDKK